MWGLHIKEGRGWGAKRLGREAGGSGTRTLPPSVPVKLWASGKLCIRNWTDDDGVRASRTWLWNAPFCLLPGQAVCNCLPKYTGDGKVCTLINVCLTVSTAPSLHLGCGVEVASIRAASGPFLPHVPVAELETLQSLPPSSCDLTSVSGSPLPVRTLADLRPPD